MNILIVEDEKDMLMEFGNTYNESMKTTKMFIPFVTQHKKDTDAPSKKFWRY